MDLVLKLNESIKEAFQELYLSELDDKLVNIQKTRSEFEGDFTLVVFPFLKFSKKSPEATADEIGKQLKKEDYISDYNVIKGFLNISFTNDLWISFLNNAINKKSFEIIQKSNEAQKIMIEFSSPNTNKPLHLGHIRNNLLGYSIAKILEANGHQVRKVNLVNDRGIHICKSMLAWQKWGKGATPEKNKIKGDKLVGEYYVLFDKEYKKEINKLIESGISEDEAKVKAPILLEAQEMLRKWESGDKSVVSLWKTMNNWVYKGFDITYKNLGIFFDKTYYESETYKKGKKLVLEGLEKNVLKRKEDKSVWADLTMHGLDEKILLRADGTSVYMTQDLGTAFERYKDYKFDKHLYVVGNEQNYHFQVLKLILMELGYKWSENLMHISYGMVELPEGKMKSREGKVVDADDLIEHMKTTAKEMSKELGKLNDIDKDEAEEIINKIALAALKYFILKVDPKKNMLFNPEESIDFNGNTGPFIQYTYARIQSLLRKASNEKIDLNTLINNKVNLDKKEKDLIRLIFEYPKIVKEAGSLFSPAIIANYVYELVKLYNQFYHDYPILKEEEKNTMVFRLKVSDLTGKIIESSLSLLGIGVPERM